MHEKEMLALVDVLDDWRHYLFGVDIHIFTENVALRYLQNTARPSERQVRWLENIQLYSTLKTAYIPGKTNTAADAPPRNPSLKEAVIEVGKPPPLDLAFLVVVDISKSHSGYIQPAVFEQLSAEPAPSWWPDYLSDAPIRRVHFITETELLKDPTTWHHDRLWDYDRTIVHKARINSRLLDIGKAIAPSVRYIFDHLRR